MAEERRSENRFGNLLKNIFFLLIILQFAPAVLQGLRKQLTGAFVPRTYVGALQLRGMITDSRYYTKQINKFLKNDDIKGLVIHIDSPGGTPGSPQAIFNDLKKFKATKPVVVVIENIAASGAYYVAAGANKIICAPSSLVGNIGAYFQLPNVKGLADNWKVSMNYIQSGAYKTAGSPFKDISPKEAAMLQSVTDDTYRQFTADVAAGRGIKLADVATWGDGKIFTGTQGKALGLVDKIGSYSDAKEQMRSLLVEYGVDVEKEIKFVHAKHPTALQRLLGAETPDDNAVEMSSMLWGFAQQLLSSLRWGL